MAWHNFQPGLETCINWRCVVLLCTFGWLHCFFSFLIWPRIHCMIYPRLLHGLATWSSSSCLTTSSELCRVYCGPWLHWRYLLNCRGIVTSDPLLQNLHMDKNQLTRVDHRIRMLTQLKVRFWDRLLIIHLTSMIRPFTWPTTISRTCHQVCHNLPP